MSKREEDQEPRMVRRNALSRTPKLCPRCLSPLRRGSGLGGWLIPQDYYCEKCGYKGHAYLESRKEEQESNTKDA